MSTAATRQYPAARAEGPSLAARSFLWLLSWLLGVALALGLLAWHYEGRYEGRIVEGVALNGVALGGLTPEQAAARLQGVALAGNEAPLTLTVGGQSWLATAAELGVQLDAEATANAAYALGREGTPANDWLDRFTLWRGAGGAMLQPVYGRDPQAIEALLVTIANAVARDPEDARLEVQGLTVSATPARPGQQLDLDGARERVGAAIEANERTVELPLTERAPFIIGAEEAAEKARSLLSAPLIFSLEQPEYTRSSGSFEPTIVRRQWMVDRARLSEMLLLFSEPTESGQYAWDVRLKPEMLKDELETLAAAVNRPPRDARFNLDPATGTLTPMIVSQDGIALDMAATTAAIEEAIAEQRNEVALAVTVTPPTVSTADASKLVLNNVAAEGTSNYAGSSAERVINVGVAADQYHGLVIPPGGIFSFNEYLGWVVDAEGYEEGYIIAGNRTEVDVGGGVCQVSTTLFRSAFDAGFPIVERYAHAYRVPYYENGSPLGFDATIFSPVVDLKFRNDTDHYYLMQVENDPEATTLAIKLYGPSTGRRVELTSTVVSTEPAPPPAYEEDPTLQPGEVKQVDWEYDGARIRLDRIIYDEATGAELSRESFWSNYRPWQARYLLGPGAVPPGTEAPPADEPPPGEEAPPPGDGAPPVEEPPPPPVEEPTPPPEGEATPPPSDG